MSNDRLRTLIQEVGTDIDAIAQDLSVNRRTVERWIDEGRIPYPKHRRRLVEVLGQSERFLWPETRASASRRAEITQSEIVTVYPRRSLVPTSLWLELLEGAESKIDVLAFAGLFLPEQQPRLAATLVEKIDAGATVRILLGNPEGDAVARRGEEENIGPAMAAKVHNVLTFYEGYSESIDIRLHNATLYNSLYRFDKDMLVNTHIYGRAAAHNPVFHLRQLEGGELFSPHSEAFDRIWYQSPSAWEATAA